MSDLIDTYLVSVATVAGCFGTVALAAKDDTRLHVALMLVMSCGLSVFAWQMNALWSLVIMDMLFAGYIWTLVVKLPRAVWPKELFGIAVGQLVIDAIYNHYGDIVYGGYSLWINMTFVAELAVVARGGFITDAWIYLSRLSGRVRRSLHALAT